MDTQDPAQAREAQCSERKTVPFEGHQALQREMLNRCCKLCISLVIEPVDAGGGDIGLKRLRLIDTRSTWRSFMHIIPVRSQHTMAHARVACKVSNRNSLQPQRPGCEQMESTVPGEVIDPCGSFEKSDRRAARRRRVTSDESRYASDLQIIEPADKSAFEALFEEIFHVFQIIAAGRTMNLLYPQTVTRSSLLLFLYGNFRPKFSNGVSTYLQER